MRAQITIEFLTGVIVILFIYTISINIYDRYVRVSLLEGEEISEVCYTVSGVINDASSFGTGFSNNVSLNYKVANKDYIINITNNSTATVILSNRIFACSLVSKNITSVIVYPSKLSVTNINNKVYITSVTTDKLVYNLGETVNINGSYLINNATINILYSNKTSVQGYPKNLTNANNSVTDSFVPAIKDVYNVYLFDITEKSLSSERIISVV